MANMEIRLIIFFAAKNRKTLYSQQKQDWSWLWLRSWTPITKIRLKLKKVGKTTRPFSYDLNQIPYDYTVAVRNRFKGPDLIDRVPDELWMEVCDCTRDRDQDHPQEKEMQKSKMAVWEGLINICEKKRNEKQRRKGKIYPSECRVIKNSKENLCRRPTFNLWSGN